MKNFPIDLINKNINKQVQEIKGRLKFLNYETNNYYLGEME